VHSESYQLDELVSRSYFVATRDFYSGGSTGFCVFVYQNHRMVVTTHSLKRKVMKDFQGMGRKRTKPSSKVTVVPSLNPMLVR